MSADGTDVFRDAHSKCSRPGPASIDRDYLALASIANRVDLLAMYNTLLATIGVE